MEIELKEGQVYQCRNDNHRIVITSISKDSLKYSILYPNRKSAEQDWQNGIHVFEKALLTSYDLSTEFNVKHNRRKLSI